MLDFVGSFFYVVGEFFLSLHFFIFFISRVVSDVVGAVLEWLLTLLLLFLVEIELGYFMILLFVLFKSK